MMYESLENVKLTLVFTTAVRFLNTRDWSLVHLQNKGFIPHTMLQPGENLANHIGVEGGMHAHKMSKAALAKLRKIDTHFIGTTVIGRTGPAAKQMKVCFDCV